MSSLREAISNSEAALAAGVTTTAELVRGIKDGNDSPWASVLEQLVEASGTNGVGKRIVEGKLARGLAQVNLKLAAYSAEMAGEDVNQQKYYWTAGEEQAARMLGKYVKQMTPDEKKSLRRGEVGIVADAAVKAKFGNDGWDGFYKQTIDPLVKVENGQDSGVDGVDGPVVRKDAGSRKPEKGVNRLWQYSTVALIAVAVSALAAGATFAEQGVNGGGKPTDSCEVDPPATPGMGDENGGGCPPSNPDPNGCFHGEPDCTETPVPPTAAPTLPSASNTPESTNTHEPTSTTAASETPIPATPTPTPFATAVRTVTAWLTQVFTAIPPKTATPDGRATQEPGNTPTIPAEAILTVAPGTTQVLSNTLMIDRQFELTPGVPVVICPEYGDCYCPPQSWYDELLAAEKARADAAEILVPLAQTQAAGISTIVAAESAKVAVVTPMPLGGDGDKNKDVSPVVPIVAAVVAGLTIFGLVRNRKGQVQPAEGFGDAQGQREG